MRQYQVVIERPARDDIEHYFLRAVEAGAGIDAARWYNRLLARILLLEQLPEWRSPVPERDDFSEKLYQLIFEHRYRIIYTVQGERVHILCVRGPGMRRLSVADIQWPAAEEERG